MNKPYYEQDGITIYHGDCREILPQLDVKVDLVLTDPPYGINVLGSVGGSKRVGSVGGSNIVLANEYKLMHEDDKPFDPSFLLSFGDNQIIFGGNYYADKLPNSKGWIVWDKKCQNGWDDNFSDIEMAWTSFDKPAKCYRLLYMGLIQENCREVRQHPTQKPKELFEWIIDRYSNPNNLILDPFLGSGTTAVAAKILGRRCIGIEIEEKYCEIAVKRLAQSVMRLE